MAGEAMNKLELLRQGNRPVEKLITEFRALAQEAELEDKTNTDDRHMIKLFAACINPQLKKRILFGEVVPKTYEGWVDKAVQFDSNYWMGQALMDIDGAKGRKAFKPNKEKDPNAMDTSIGAMTEKERTALMKLGACFRCKKRGHLSKDCPDKYEGKKEEKKVEPVQAQKKFTPKEMHGSIRNMTKEERAELLALMTADDEDF